MFDTRIKRELASCHQERDQLQNILKALSQSMALIEFSPEGRILDANPLFLRVVGYRLEELQGQPHSLLCRSELSNSPAYGQFWQRLARGESISDKLPRLTKQGQDIWLEASYNPVLGASGRVEKVLKIAADISAEVRNGQPIWLRATYNPVFDSNGKLYKVVKFATDVTEQQLADLDREIEEERLRAELARRRSERSADSAEG